MYLNESEEKILGGVMFVSNDGELVKLSGITNVEFEEPIEDHDDKRMDLLNSINEPMTIACNAQMSFRTLVRIIGFWNAVKYTISQMLHKKD